MYYFGNKSKERLATVHDDLQTLFNEVIKYRDCSIVSGLRTAEEQAELYAQGRSKPGKIVTYKDGYERRSNHQSGNAVDVVPYFSAPPHIRWDDDGAFREFGGFVLGVAELLKKFGVIKHDIMWGGLWQWKDYPHYEIDHGTKK